MDPPQETEAELERFRKQWQEEVSRRAHTSAARPTARNSSLTPNVKPSVDVKRKPIAPSSLAPKAPPRRIEGHDAVQEDALQAYHDLPDKEADLRLDAADHGLVRGALSADVEPRSALEHYERAVEKETTGSLGDSLLHYRKAFKLDDRVHEQYKNKHFPPSAFPPKRPALPPSQQKHVAPASSSTPAAQINPLNASETVPNPAHHSSQAGGPASLSELVQEFSQLSIPGAPAPTDADPPPPCPIAALPGELLSDILKYTAVMDLSSLSRLSQVCKRFAYLVMTDQQVWRRIAQGSEYGFAGMHYDYVCDILGQLLPDDYSDIYLADETNPEVAESSTLPRSLAKTTPEIDTHLLQSVYRSSWRTMFRLRPRLRFNGCYISTVNYTRPGAASTDTRTWGTPIHIVTYFRYLRFFRDGTVISLLTTTEPVDVVHHLTKENLSNVKERSRAGGILPTAVMKDALRGRWRLSGPGPGPGPSSSKPNEEVEAEGDVHVETEGVIPKYMWKMQFSLGSAGRKDGARNNKLGWVGFWSYNKLTDDWGEFGLKNDKAFYFSRVRGFGMGY